MTEQTHTFVGGRSQRQALLLLTAAAELDLHKEVVQAQRNGYRVPTEVAERAAKLGTELEKAEKQSGTAGEKAAAKLSQTVFDSDAPNDEQRLAAEAEAEQSTATKKTTAKRTTAKKTTAKKTAAKSTTASAKE
jgi:hypothetical protein